ncbi:MAG: UDP-3-O-acyl-N-acetylglucosamine deacetylase [Phycisphaerales bacterium JB039]
MTARRTLGAEALIEGAGLFTGAACRAAIRPGAGGIALQRDGVRIPAQVASLSMQPAHAAFARLPARSTNLEARGARALTVEHILSALAGLGVTDALVVLTGDEIPILDGSSDGFVRAIQQAGVVDAPGAIEPIVVAEPVTVEQDTASITALPRQAPGWSVRYELDYGAGAPIAPQQASWDGAADSYERDIAPARTFCTDREAMAMRGLGLFGHLSAKEMLVIGPDGPVDNTMRFDNEPARHKLLDVIGDLALAGRPIQADIVARRSGHALNHELARRLAQVAGQPAP